MGHHLVSVVTYENISNSVQAVDTFDSTFSITNAESTKKIKQTIVCSVYMDSGKLALMHTIGVPII
jgi:outer membrane translocation and assembly module TamA